MLARLFYTIVPAILTIMVVVIAVMLFLVKALWAWTIPDLFPGAVAQGLVAGQISWYTAFKLAVFLGFFAGLAGARKQPVQQVVHYERG